VNRRAISMQPQDQETLNDDQLPEIELGRRAVSE